MTHDELLEKVDSKLQVCTCDGWGNNCWEDENQPWKALRAVVELHKPVVSEWTKDAYPENTPMAYRRETEPKVCEECSPYFGDVGIDYPCPTIQKIMDELK